MWGTKTIELQEIAEHSKPQRSTSVVVIMTIPKKTSDLLLQLLGRDSTKGMIQPSNHSLGAQTRWT